MVFIGSDIHTIDAKGRIFVPTRFKGLGETFVLFTWPDKECIYAMDPQEFENMISKLKDDDSLPEAMAEYLDDVLLAEADYVDMDTQKRIVIKAELREFAGLKREVAIVGKDDHVEFWDKEAWDKRRAESMEKLKESAVGSLFNRRRGKDTDGN